MAEEDVKRSVEAEQAQEQQNIAEQQPTDNETVGPKPFRSQFTMDFDNLDEELSKVPLFMTDLPDEENDSLAALQSLVFDGTPEEVAQNFREQGNDCFRAGKAKYKDAIIFYTKAIETECKDQSIIEACLANRAACNLELQNYGRVLNDCSKCLKINPKNVKALYRSSKALFALDKLVECIDCCDHALAIDPDNKPVKDVKERAVTRKAILDKKAKEKEERERREREKKEKLENAFKERNIKIEVVDKEVREKANIELDEETQTINWPVFFLYPEYKESDYIQSFNETHTFNDHLEIMFEQPAPWDAKHEYNPKNLEVYFEDTRGLQPKLLKVGKKLSLGKILSLDQYVIKNGVPSFIILSKDSAFKQEFLNKFKKQ
ncbi:hypothetical protein BDF20DRAFT_814535 [Mycotypha africana]|uniref:uncharacterized protein n=1 Tax=Mycotypha africana TaxID=64632 RepID=UPI002301928A|nr:uncharacterized protein BDF20DRAFT_814535 [Mycotypha africana]KAI8987390.1 hypothetical protein BDF20DRAFT_814535 [Mycotypha africana]